MNLQRENKPKQNHFEEQHGYNRVNDNKFVQQSNIQSFVQENSHFPQAQEQQITDIRYHHDPVRQNQLLNDTGDLQIKKRGFWRTVADFFQRLFKPPLIVQQQQEQIQDRQRDKLITRQFVSQEENSIQKDLICFLFDKIFMDQIRLEIQNSQIDLEIKPQEDSSYVLQYFKRDEAKAYDFQRLITAKINQTVILKHKCQSEQEVRVKLKILHNLRYQLQKILFTKEYKVETLLDYQTSKEINNLEETNEIFAIIIQEQNISINELQTEFDNLFSTDNKYIKYLEDHLEITLSNQIDMNDLQMEYDNLNKEDFCITFHPPKKDNQTNNHIIQIDLKLWMKKNTCQDKKGELEMMKNRLLKMKEKLRSMFYTQLKMGLNQIERKIWDYVLCDRYCGLQNIKFFIELQPFTISIEGERTQTKLVQEEIESQFRSLDYRCLIYNAQVDCLNTLSKQQTIKIFSKDLNDIKQQFNVPYAQVSQIDLAQQLINFEIIWDSQNTKQLKKVIKSLIVSQIKVQNEDYDLGNLLQFYQKSQLEFEEQYNCYIDVHNSQRFQIVTLKQHLDKLTESLNRFKETLKKDQFFVQISDIQNEIVFGELEMILNNNRYPFTQITFSKNPNVIKISGPKEYALKEEDKIRQISKDINDILFTKRISMFKTEWEYLENKQKVEMDKIKCDYRCCFQVSNRQDNQLEETIHAKLSINGKQIILKCGDIINQKCDAIINSCNDTMIFDDITSMSGVAKVIFQFGGSQYHQFAKDYIKKYHYLSGPIIYKIPNPQNINAIISVPTLHYKQAGEDLDQFINNIIKIFKIAENENYKSIVIPILGGESASFFFPTACRNVLTNVIEQIKHCKSIEKVIIIEINSQKVEMIQKTLHDILYPPRKRQILYQWQYYDSDWTDYDDFEVNQQIDEGYEQYLQNKSKCQIEINFPYTKQPGTHLIDLNQMKITDMALNITSDISIKQQQNGQKYHFYGQSVHDSLNEYIELQKCNHIMVFGIFLKKYKIKFGDQDIIQVNLKTNYERKVRKTLKQKQEQQDTNSLFNNVQFDFKIEKPSTQQTNTIISIEIFLFNENRIHEIDNKLRDLLEQSQKKFLWKVKNFKDVDLIAIENTIKEESVRVQGQIKQGNELEITCFKEAAIKLQHQLYLMEQQYIIFPEEWIYQSYNLIKVQLNQQDEDYKKVQQQFQKTYPQGILYQINRIQNKLLYENFINEKRKLIQLKQTQGQTLSQDQLSKYLWHGVKSQHPSIIYDSLSEAFKNNYCNPSCMWGPGIYFAGQAQYSKEYAYKLTPQESVDYPNKLIFLLCEVVIGNSANLAPNNALKEPPQGFDSVNGLANNSQIYILYGMDVRRAYPSFEIIFE